jgi:exodeoxyribonuclease V gamma subunit
VNHPLQPFSADNFGRDGLRRSYAGAWFRAAERLAVAPLANPPAFIQRLPEPDASWLQIEPADLLECFRSPAKFLLQKRLGLRLADSEDGIAADEPFGVDSLVQWRLRELALQAMERGWSEAQERRIAHSAGWLPSGELGNVFWGEQRGPVRAFAPRLFEARPDDVPQPLLVDIQLAGVRIHGWLDGVTRFGLFEWRLKRPGAKDLSKFWLRHLLLNCAAGADIQRDSLLISPAGDWQLGALDDPQALLEPWLAAYREALCSPLPFLPQSSHAFAKALCTPSERSKKEPLEAAKAAAANAWLGSEFGGFSGEALDPWNALAFRDREALGEQFEALAEQLLGPALTAIAAQEEQA